MSNFYVGLRNNYKKETNFKIKRAVTWLYGTARFNILVKNFPFSLFCQTENFTYMKLLFFFGFGLFGFVTVT